MSCYKTVTIGDVVDCANTWNPLRSVSDDVFNYIDLSAIDQDTKSIVGSREVVCGNAPSRARQLIAKGDVLVATVRPNLNGVALVPEELDGSTASTGFCVLRPCNNSIDGAYLFQWVKSPTFVKNMIKKATGANYPAVSDRIILESRIPLPPLPEQRRIAEILDRAEALRAKRRAALAQLDTLTQAIFLDLFGDPTMNPKKWPMLPFEEICESRLGKMLDQKQQTGKHLRPYLRNANVQWFHFDLTTLLKMDFGASAREEFRLKNGDLLICEGGEPGRAAIWRGQLAECYYQKALHRARPNKTLANPEYLAWLLFFLSNSGALRDHVTSATIAHFTGEKLKAMRIPLPPLDLQREFARSVTAVEKLKAAHRASLAEMDALFASLQHRAFRGEL
ncbi:MAG: restriction endonuclease subunit S [Syntrophales bacterium]|nr:restriction endonuclease subunit S [Syntrophales bacterium]